MVLGLLTNKIDAADHVDILTSSSIELGEGMMDRFGIGDKSDYDKK